MTAQNKIGLFAFGIVFGLMALALAVTGVALVGKQSKPEVTPDKAVTTSKNVAGDQVIDNLPARVAQASRGMTTDEPPGRLPIEIAKLFDPVFLPDHPNEEGHPFTDDAINLVFEYMRKHSYFKRAISAEHMERILVDALKTDEMISKNMAKEGDKHLLLWISEDGRYLIESPMVNVGKISVPEQFKGKRNCYFGIDGRITWAANFRDQSKNSKRSRMITKMAFALDYWYREYGAGR